VHNSKIRVHVSIYNTWYSILYYCVFAGALHALKYSFNARIWSILKRSISSDLTPTTVNASVTFLRHTTTPRATFCTCSVFRDLLYIPVLFILVINQLDAHFLFYNKFISCLYMFRANVLIIRKSKLHYTASGIMIHIRGRPAHRLREDWLEYTNQSSLNLCILYHQVLR